MKFDNAFAYFFSFVLTGQMALLFNINFHFDCKIRLCALGCVHTESELAKWRQARRSEAAKMRLANRSEFRLIYDHKHGICSLPKIPS